MPLQEERKKCAHEAQSSRHEKSKLKLPALNWSAEKDAEKVWSKLSAPMNEKDDGKLSSWPKLELKVLADVGLAQGLLDEEQSELV